MTNGVYAVFKCDTNGNILKSRYFADGHGLNGARPTGIIKVPDSDMMMLLGKGFFVTNCHTFNNTRGKRISIPQHEPRPEFSVET